MFADSYPSWLLSVNTSWDVAGRWEHVKDHQVSERCWLLQCQRLSNKPGSNYFTNSRGLVSVRPLCVISKDLSSPSLATSSWLMVHSLYRNRCARGRQAKNKDNESSMSHPDYWLITKECAALLSCLQGGMDPAGVRNAQTSFWWDTPKPRQEPALPPQYPHTKSHSLSRPTPSPKVA